MAYLFFWIVFVAFNLGTALYSLDPKFLSQNIFIPQVQEDCEVSGICENSPDYPHEYVEALLAKLPDANIRFNLDMETPETSQTGELESQQTVPLCKPKFRIIYPDKARTSTGKWVFIVNGRTTKVQGFSGTLCLGEGEPCNGKISLPKGYRSKCAQKYIDRSMWALDHTGELALVTAPIASCCICELETNSTANYFKKNHLYRSFP
ncbi:hypothetical protein ABMA27_000701 [Loxostege sticticalis]|uniref:Spaetzle domain-containing protein n=1 Tax=Loxostege sticticalis TaxID=481309 RepID=A0ABR3HZZ7_LOXSC